MTWIGDSSVLEVNDQWEERYQRTPIMVCWVSGEFSWELCQYLAYLVGDRLLVSQNQCVHGLRSRDMSLYLRGRGVIMSSRFGRTAKSKSWLGAYRQAIRDVALIASRAIWRRVLMGICIWVLFPCLAHECSSRRWVTGSSLSGELGEVGVTKWCARGMSGDWIFCMITASLWDVTDNAISDGAGSTQEMNCASSSPDSHLFPFFPSAFELVLSESSNVSGSSTAEDSFV